MKHSAATMMNSRSKVLTSALLLVLSLSSGAAMAEPKVSGNLGLTSDYLFRGISQTDEGMALQGGLTLAGDSGFYLSTWGSNINFGQGSMELDILAGWTGQIGEAMWYNIACSCSIVTQMATMPPTNLILSNSIASLIYGGMTFGLAYSGDLLWH